MESTRRCYRPGTPPPGGPLFFGVGRFVEKKAPYLTVMAFKKVHDRYPSARLVLAGDGELLEVTRNVAISLELQSAVSFPGVLSPAEVAAQMPAAPLLSSIRSPLMSARARETRSIL